MSFDAISALRIPGTALGKISESHRAVLSQLSEAEVAVIRSVQDRLNAAGGGEVQGQSADTGDVDVPDVNCCICC